MTQRDFLTVLERQNTRERVSSNLSYHNPEALEMLAVNLLETPDDFPRCAYETPKQVGFVYDEDVIEVFI